MMSGKRDSNSRPQPWQGCALPTELFPQIVIPIFANGNHRNPLIYYEPLYRAENETRTRDPNLGKVVLYQLSYFRRYFLFPCAHDKNRTCTSLNTRT